MPNLGSCSLGHINKPILTVNLRRSKLYSASWLVSPAAIVELPFPGAVFNNEGDRLPASYCNFLIINKAVLLPVYDCPQDAQAIIALTSCFPE